MHLPTKTVTSKDGTRIAYETQGSGPPLVLVDGAFCSRNFGPMPELAKLVASRFTVVTYDRRGRHESGNSASYAVAREVEDLQALVDAVGGAAHLCGFSSGAVLAARAAASGMRVKSLMMFEPPLSLDGTRIPEPIDFREQIAAMIKADRRSDAVKLFLRVVGVPRFGVMMMSVMPGVFSKMNPVAHTLNNDFAILGDTQSGGAMPAELVQTLAAVRVPTTTIAGGKSPPYLHHAAKRVAEQIPGAQFRVLPGQMHNVAPKAIAPLVIELCSETHASEARVSAANGP